MKNRYMLLGVLLALFVALGVLSGCRQSQPDPASFGCGCSGQLAQPQPTETKGSRLQPYQLIANDGTTARVHDRYYDNVLGVACSFVAPTDESPVLYCLPKDAPWLYGGYFNDEDCAIPVAFVNNCGTLPKYVKQSKENGCYDELTAFYEVIGSPTNPNNVYWKSPEDGSCVNQNNPSNGSTIVLIGDALPWDTFVSASIEPVAD